MVKFLIEDLFTRGLLKRAERSKELAEKSLKQAEFFLNETIDLIRLEKKRMAIIALYNAYFHVTRALLFKDGVKEKSHYAVARYLEYEYVDKGKLNRNFLLVLDAMRDHRHESQYAVDEIEIEIDFEGYIETCKKFIEIVRVILKD